MDTLSAGLVVEAADYRSRRRGAKEGRAMRVAVAVVLVGWGALATTGCTSFTLCRTRIPEAVRADAMRFAFDRKLLPQEDFPPKDRVFALTHGTPAKDLPEEGVGPVRTHAVGYAHCIRERWRAK